MRAELFHADGRIGRHTDMAKLIVANFRSRTVHLYITRIGVFYLPTDAQENFLKNNIKIYIKTVPTCFCLITIIRERIIRAS